MNIKSENLQVPVKVTWNGPLEIKIQASDAD